MQEWNYDYHRARYYDPRIGAWLSLDPLEGCTKNAGSLNRYLYSLGSVANRIDPSGFISYPLPPSHAFDSCNLDDEEPCEGFARLKWVGEYSGNANYFENSYFMRTTTDTSGASPTSLRQGVWNRTGNDLYNNYQFQIHATSNYTGTTELTRCSDKAKTTLRLFNFGCV